MILSKATKTVKTVAKDVKVQVEGMKHADSVPHLVFILDPTTGTKYIRGRLLGKGGFAKCYEVVEVDSEHAYAGKIIPKTRISKPHQRLKIEREISVHSQLSHKNVVAFHRYFEDDENVYIILEKCDKKSLIHFLKQRKTFTEPEVRYFMRQIIEGVQYLHNMNVIHRDLKLGNLFVSQDMTVKIGDFGLAARLEFDGDRKRTICGTPNYIAPEVLVKIGHSYEADVWAIGCIMYTMLVGRPPFETGSLKETYSRIKQSKYSLPSALSNRARAIIKQILNNDPAERPTLEAILEHQFFAGYVPKRLPSSAVTFAPVFAAGAATEGGSLSSESDSFSRLVVESSLTEIKNIRDITPRLAQVKLAPPPKVISKVSPIQSLARSKMHALKTAISTVIDPHRGQSESKFSDVSPAKVSEMLNTCLDHMPRDEYSTTPKYKPKDSEVLWVTKWVDYSNKYGFGYQLSDNSVGVIFNDASRICFTPDRSTVQYHAAQKVHVFGMGHIPQKISNKVTLLDYFSTYMDEHLIMEGEARKLGCRAPPAKGGEVTQPSSLVETHVQPYMTKWYRTNEAVAMYLNNGTLQINFFKDHTKLILSYNDSDHLVSYIDHERLCHTHRLLHVAHHGCCAPLLNRMQYAQTLMKHMVD